MRSVLIAIPLVLGLASVGLAQDTPPGPPPGLFPGVPPGTPPGAPPPNAPPALRSDQIGQIFCFSRLGNDEAPITGLLSDELKAAIADAEAKNADWEKANPGEKPPLGDGIPWQSWPDYAPQCEVGITAWMISDAKVEIKYSFPDQPDADFTDTLLLKRSNPDGAGFSVWRIDNLAYATGSDLRTALGDAFAE